MGDQNSKGSNDLQLNERTDVEAARTITDEIEDLDEHTHYSQRAPWLRYVVGFYSNSV
jgi:hypothetical protein